MSGSIRAGRARCPLRPQPALASSADRRPGPGPGRVRRPRLDLERERDLAAGHLPLRPGQRYGDRSLPPRPFRDPGHRLPAHPGVRGRRAGWTLAGRLRRGRRQNPALGPASRRRRPGRCLRHPAASSGGIGAPGRPRRPGASGSPLPPPWPAPTTASWSTPPAPARAPGGAQPHLKWTTRPEWLPGYAARQLALLAEFAPRVRPGRPSDLRHLLALPNRKRGGGPALPGRPPAFVPAPWPEPSAAEPRAATGSFSGPPPTTATASSPPRCGAAEAAAFAFTPSDRALFSASASNGSGSRLSHQATGL